MNNRIEKLTKEMERLRNASKIASMPFDKKIREIDELLWAEKVKLAEKNVGKCYVYERNCYSCPETDADYWNTFFKVTSLHKAVDKDDFDYYCVLKIEKDSRGNIEIKQYKEGISSYRFDDRSHKEIKPKEFNKVFNRLLAELGGAGK